MRMNYDTNVNMRADFVNKTYNALRLIMISKIMKIAHYTSSFLSALP